MLTIGKTYRLQLINHDYNSVVINMEYPMFNWIWVVNISFRMGYPDKMNSFLLLFNSHGKYVPIEKG